MTFIEKLILLRFLAAHESLRRSVEVMAAVISFEHVNDAKKEIEALSGASPDFLAKVATIEGETHRIGIERYSAAMAELQEPVGDES